MYNFERFPYEVSYSYPITFQTECSTSSVEPTNSVWNHSLELLSSDENVLEVEEISNEKELEDLSLDCREVHKGSFLSATTEETFEEPLSGTRKPSFAEELDTSRNEIDQKLDFILNSCKRGSEENVQVCTPKIMRKNKKQVEILKKELGNCEKVDSKKLKELAAKTGLKKLQVYKWFWDNKKMNKRKAH